jgi:hypothetical protein
MINLTEEDIQIIDYDNDQVTVGFYSLEGLEILWSKQQAEQLKQQIIENQTKAARYDALQDRYSNSNEKHFGELCGIYFDDDKLLTDTLKREE